MACKTVRIRGLERTVASVTIIHAFVSGSGDHDREEDESPNEYKNGARDESGHVPTDYKHTKCVYGDSLKGRPNLSSGNRFIQGHNAYE